MESAGVVPHSIGDLSGGGGVCGGVKFPLRAPPHTGKKDFPSNKGLTDVSWVLCETFWCCDGLVSLPVVWMSGPKGGDGLLTYGVYSVAEPFASKVHGEMNFTETCDSAGQTLV